MYHIPSRSPLRTLALSLLMSVSASAVQAADWTQYGSIRTSGGYGGTTVNHPVVDGRLYMRCADGKIRCYDVSK